MRDRSSWAFWACASIPLALSLAGCGDRVLDQNPGGDSKPTDQTPVTPTDPVVQRDCSQGVRLTDPALDGAVRAAFGPSLPAGLISATDAAGLTELRAPELGIRSLAGLECFLNLQLLELDRNEIADISPLAGLVHLTALDLNENKVHSIAAVARMTEMHELNLGDNDRIDDLRPIGGMTKLFQLNVPGNAIQDLRPLGSALSELRMLDLSRNSISDVSPLIALPFLGELWLSGNPVTNLSPLASASELYSLTLQETPSADLSTLSSATLINIDLSRNTVATQARLPPQQLFPSLKWISFAESNLGDIDINRLLPTLAALDVESLVLTDNQISNVTPFAQAHSGNLYLTNNRITDLSPILTFPSPPLLFVDVRTNPFDCGAQSKTIHDAGPVYIYTDCP